MAAQKSGNEKVIKQVLPLEFSRKRRSSSKGRATVPESLKAVVVTHNYPEQKKLPAEVLLSWSDSSSSEVRFPFSISPEAASYLLEIFVPCVYVNASERALVGQADISCALLSVLDPKTLIAVRYIESTNPFATARLPMHLLLPPSTLADQLSIIEDLVAMISGAELSQAKLAKLTGKDRSTISKVLSKNVTSPDVAKDE